MILTHIDTVVFNPSLKEHRSAVALFMKRNAWGDSPIRFTHDPMYGSVADQVRTKMLTWYMARDSASKTVKKVANETNAV